LTSEGQPLAKLGICGVYCGACTTYRAYNDGDQSLFDWEIRHGMPRDEIVCKGCRSELVNKWCSRCKFRRCISKRKVENCFQCGGFPCKKLVDFSKTRPHRTLGLRNLTLLKEMSVAKWLRQQEKRWTCSSCRKKLHWYTENCPQCGARFLNATQEAKMINTPH